MHTDPIREFLDFLVPPVLPRKEPTAAGNGNKGKKKTESDPSGHSEMQLADFNLEMRYADSWRELRALIEAMYDQMERQDSQQGPKGYNMFTLKSRNRLMVVGMRKGEDGKTVNIMFREVTADDQDNREMNLQFSFG